MRLSAEQKALLQLGCTDGIGPVTARGLIEHFGSAQATITATPQELSLAPGVSRKLIQLLKSPKGREKAEQEVQILKTLEQNGVPIRLYFLGDEEYPAYLEHCFDAPLVLYVKGQIPQGPMISIVGTRKNTPYSIDALKYLIEGFASLRPDLTIVSGLAYGIDKLSHETALRAGLKSVAVVAHGHYTLYPTAHKHLAREMIERGGGIITEYTYNTRALPQRFVARNRIVAGLSSATLVIESAIKGGSLITGNIAFDYGRSVYALPGRLFDSTSAGCNKLIAYQKASIITTPEQILKELSLLPDQPMEQKLPFSDTSDVPAHPILSELQKVDELTLEDLALRLGEEVPTISAQLFDLELDGLIRALPGGRYALKHY